MGPVDGGVGGAEMFETPLPALVGAVLFSPGAEVFFAPFFFCDRVLRSATLSVSSLLAAEVAVAAGVASPYGGAVGTSVGEEGAAAPAAANLVVGSAALRQGSSS